MDIIKVPANATPQEILRLGITATNGRVKVACSFSVEDVVIIDMIKRLNLPVTIFALDTGRLNEETYEVAEALTERYRIDIEWYFPKPEAVEKVLRQKGPYSFRESLENRHECCGIRKVEPLQRALADAGGWVTGLRKAQNVTRTEMKPIEQDVINGGILKISPLLEWSDEEVWGYARENGVPTNRLHKQGYPSIGCEPCTRAIREGEHPRAGRWWWENPEHKECGLHKR